MENPQNDFMKRFQAMLASLAPEKRTQLYQALQKMEPSKRNAAMKQILDRYEMSVKGAAPKATAATATAANPAKARSQQKPQPQPQSQQQSQPQAKTKPQAPAASPAAKQRPQQPAKPKVKPQVDVDDEKDSEVEKPVKAKEAKKAKKQKRLTSPFVVVFLILIILMAGFLLFMTLVMDRNILPDIFGKDSSVQTVATEAEVVPTETSAIEPSTTPEPTATPTQTPTPEPTRVPLAENAPNLTGLTIVIDPGHQEKGDDTPEANATWLSNEKPRCTAGTKGVVTGVQEYELTLEYSLIIKDYLEQCGATVIITRTTNDVNLSNQERAQIAVNANADLFFRIHADKSNNSKDSGVKISVADSGDYSSSLPLWGEQLGNLIATAEGLPLFITYQSNTYTGLNYANSVKSFQISLGFLSNSDDEAVITNTEDNAGKVAAAIAMFCADFTL